MNMWNSGKLPTNINYLAANGFQFTILKAPEVQYFCTSVNIPTINLGAPTQNTSLVDSYLPGDKLTFDPLSIDFIVDEEMKNYAVLYNWITSLAPPIDSKQYKAFIQNTGPQQSLAYSEMYKGVSDASLTVLDSSNNSNRVLTFIDIFPTAIQGFTFTSTDPDTRWMLCTATFRYTYFTFA